MASSLPTKGDFDIAALLKDPATTVREDKQLGYWVITHGDAEWTLTTDPRAWVLEEDPPFWYDFRDALKGHHGILTCFSSWLTVLWIVIIITLVVLNTINGS